MSSYSYWYINIRTEDNCNAIMSRLGELFEIAILKAGVPENQLTKRFVESGMAHQFERQNPMIIKGQSGLEIAIDILKGSEFESAVTSIESPCPVGFTAEHWIGEMIGYFQIHYGYSYQDIFKACTFKWMRMIKLAYTGEDTPEAIAQEMLERMDEFPPQSKLREYRKQAGLKQSELAEMAGVSLRAIQQYEQGAKNINHASAASLYKISMALGCLVEDLLQMPIE